MWNTLPTEIRNYHLPHKISRPGLGKVRHVNISNSHSTLLILLSLLLTNMLLTCPMSSARCQAATFAWLGYAYINGAAEQASAKHWKFVNDLNLLEVKPSTVPATFQHDLADLERRSFETSMVLHPKKCKVLHFHSKKTPSPKGCQ